MAKLAVLIERCERCNRELTEPIIKERFHGVKYFEIICWGCLNEDDIKLANEVIVNDWGYVSYWI